MKPQNFNKIVADIAKKRGLNPYKLYKLVEDSGAKITDQTIYNFMQGKPVKSDTLAIILAALDLKLIELMEGKE